MSYIGEWGGGMAKESEQREQRLLRLWTGESTRHVEDLEWFSGSVWSECGV